IAGLQRVTPESLEEVQPLTTSSGCGLVFNGRLDDRSQLSTDLGVPLSAPDPEFLAAAVDAYGEEFPRSVAGEFAIAISDPVRRQLLLATDAMGMKPIYLSELGSTVLFGTEMKALLAHPRQQAQPNDDLLAYYLLQGTARDNLWDTFFKGIRVVGPGSLVR